VAVCQMTSACAIVSPPGQLHDEIIEQTCYFLLCQFSTLLNLVIESLRALRQTRSQPYVPAGE
jgi:hypothetical protein